MPTQIQSASTTVSVVLFIAGMAVLGSIASAVAYPIIAGELTIRAFRRLVGKSRS